MTWKEIQPDEVKPGDYIDVNGKLTELVEVDGLTGYVNLDDGKHQIPVPLAALFGAKFKRKVEDPQHELIPTEHGAVIRIGKCVYENHHGKWVQVGVEVLFSHETVQWCADRRGFDVLWPKPSAEITEEMVERAGREVWKVFFHRYGKEADDEWAQNSPSTRDYHKAQARRVLEAALGGEQE